jgi:hypothetical protein
MTVSGCEEMRDLLPELAAGTLASERGRPVREHLSSCADCRAEFEILRNLRAELLQEGPVPPGLEGRIQARVREELGAALMEGTRPDVLDIRAVRRRRRMPTWALSAAAMLVLALGTGVLWDRFGQDGPLDSLEVASQDPAPEAWLWDDGMVAGAPVLDGLSDEDLEALLQEFEG